MPLTIYADILVLVNLYVDFFLLWAVNRFLGLRARNRRLVLGALVGGLLALTALLPAGGALSLALGAAGALATTAAAFAPLPWGAFLRAAGCFWLCALGLAGLALFLARVLSPKGLAVLGGVVYLDLSPGMLFICTCGAYLLLELARRLLPAGRGGLRCRWLTIQRAGRSVRVFAKEDTGNALREPFSELPVVVCQADRLRELAPAAALAFLEGGGPAGPEDGLRLVPFESLGGAGVLPAFQPDAVRLDGGTQAPPCYVALCPRPLGPFQALVDPALFPDPQRNHGGT